MNKVKQQDLIRITNKNLIDERSDQLYKPFRELSFRYLIENQGQKSQNYNGERDLSQNSLIPSKLNGIQIASQPMDPNKKFIKVAQRQRQYQAIEEGVLKKLQQKSSGFQSIAYKYSDWSSDNQQSVRYKSIHEKKTHQNRANFKQDLNERMLKISELKEKHQGYNLYSILDEPFNFIRQKF